MPANHRNASSNIPGSTANPQLVQDITPGIGSTSDHKAVIVGLYGVPGSGKIVLLKRELVLTHFAFYEGSMMIVTIVPGDLTHFKAWKNQRRRTGACVLSTQLERRALIADKLELLLGIICSGQRSRRLDGQWSSNMLYDLKILTHILYLEIPAEIVARCCLDDTEKGRASTSASHLQKWQQKEKTELRYLCRRNGIMFSLVSPYPTTLLNKCLALLDDFRCHTEKYNLSQAERSLDYTVNASLS